MRLLFLTFQLITFQIFAQCPATIASLGKGNGIQVCWETGQRPANLDSIWYDNVLYLGENVAGGQDDCWRSNGRHRLDVLGNHKIQFLLNGSFLECYFTDGELEGFLPLEIVYFDVKEHAKMANIAWDVRDADIIEIQHSIDAVNFSTVYYSRSLKDSYNYRPNQGDNYFRIKLTGDNGVMYSDIRHLKSDLSDFLCLVNGNTLFLRLDQLESVLIYSQSGVVVIYSEVIGSTEIDISELPDGIYYLRIGNSHNKFIKNSTNILLY